MDVEDHRLKRTLLGYRRDDVRRLLTDREAMFASATQALVAAEGKARAAEDKTHQAEDKVREAEEKSRSADQRARSAESEARAAESKVREAQEKLDELVAELANARRRLEERPDTAISTGTASGSETVPSVSIGTPSSAGELTSVLAATEEAVTRLFEDARRRAEDQVREADRRRGEVETEIEHLTEWWNRIEPLVSDVRASIEEAKNQVTSVADRIEGVLQPVKTAFGSLGTRLTVLAEKAAIPVDGTSATNPAGPPSPPEVVQVGEPAEAADETVGDEAVVGDVEAADSAADQTAAATAEHRGRTWWS